MTHIRCNVKDCRYSIVDMCSLDYIEIDYTEAEGVDMAYCANYQRKEVIYIDHTYEYVKPKW